jgi:hypothetical protein
MHTMCEHGRLSEMGENIYGTKKVAAEEIKLSKRCAAGVQIRGSAQD